MGVYADSGTQVRSNVIYSNPVGLVLGYYFSSQVVNNLIYANLNQGILAQAGYGIGFDLVNNTVYQVTGDAVRIDSSVENARLRNNILWTQAGYDIWVASDSQTGFQSDYNLLYTSGTGQTALWQGVPRPTLIAWQNAAFTDSNSLAQNPQFVDPDGADNLLGWVSALNDGSDDDFHEQSLYGSFHGGALAPVLNAATGLPVFPTATLTVDAAQSPAIDRGNAADSITNEPAPNGGYINLGAYGNTAQASKSPTEYVLVTKPDGGEVWPASQTFPIRWRTNKDPSAYALQFDGSNDYVDMGDPVNNSLDLGAAFTIEAWVKFNALPSYNLATIVSKDQGSGSNNKWIFGYANNYSGITNATFFHINNPSNGSIFLSSSAWTPVVGQWYHLALVKNGTNYTFYRDGVVDGTASTAIPIPDVASTFQVGRAENTFYLNGALDDLRLWTTARSQTDIANNLSLNLPGSTPGLAGLWQFNDASGTSALDATANANNGTLGGGVAANRPAWIASDIPSGQVDIELLDGTTVVSTIADNTTNDGEFLWTIPDLTTPGTNYKIRITRSDNPALSDTSNTPFTITAPITVYLRQ